MTNRNDYLRHLDTDLSARGRDYVPEFASNREPVRAAFRPDTRTEAQRAADRSRAKLAASIAKGHDRGATLRGVWVRRGGDL